MTRDPARPDNPTPPATEPPVQDSGALCPECDYNLTGAPGTRCPWCGWNINAAAMAALSNRRGARRWVVAATCCFLGLGTLAVAEWLVVRGRELRWLDAVSMLAVLLGAAGHLTLAVVAALSRTVWPLRRGEAFRILGLSGWLAIVLGIAGATSALGFAPAPLYNERGVQVNGVFEFLLASLFFSLPGATLLVMRLVSFREAVSEPQAPLATDRSRPPPVEPTVPFSVELYGRWGRAAVEQPHVSAPRPTSPAVERLITEAWEAESALAATDNRLLYDAPLARLIRTLADHDHLILELGTTTYREFVGTHFHHAAAIRRLNPQYLAQALGVSALVQTSDGYLAFGRRNRRVAWHAGFLHAFGGMVEAADRLPDGRYNAFGRMLEELHEETTVQATEVTDLALIGLVRDRALFQPELLFDVRVSLTRAQLSARIDHAAAGAEHTAVEWMFDEPDGVAPFLRAARPVTPVAQAALLLHGRSCWGSEWFEHVCYDLYGGPPRLPEPPGAAPPRTD